MIVAFSIAKVHTVKLSILITFLTSARPSFVQGLSGILTNVNKRKMSSLSDFLAQKPTFNHVVIGNPAGDADSIVSSLSLAYVDFLTGRNPILSPIVSVPRADLPLRRETVLLLELIQVSTVVLTCLDDLPSSLPDSRITLVDHNKLSYPQLDSGNVVEILDHHLDEQSHTNVLGEYRNIAFRGLSALVGSTCTLIAERYLRESGRKIPPDLALVLLGVILLDTVNMSCSAAKGTARDQAVIDELVGSTDWSILAHMDGAKHLFTNPQTLDKTALFSYLSESKFDAVFWNSLSAKDTLRMDYKEFTSENGHVFGTASVLLPIEDFLEKPSIEESVESFMEDHRIPVLLLLSLVVRDNQAQRSILICGRVDNTILDPMSDFLARDDSLLLTEVKCVIMEAFRMRRFRQGNAKASRKQVVPIVLDFFNNIAGSSGAVK